MGLAVSEQSLASLWDLQAETSRKRQGVYSNLELRSGKPAVIRIHMATKTREVDEVSLETKEKKKEFQEGGHWQWCRRLRKSSGKKPENSEHRAGHWWP